MQCFKRRNNILAKVLRLNQWRGSTNISIWVINSNLLMNQEKKPGKKIKNNKSLMGLDLDHFIKQLVNRVDIYNHQDERLLEVENQIGEVNDRITELNSLLYTDLTEEDVILVRIRIEEKIKARER